MGPVILERCCQVLVNPPALAFEVSHPERVQTNYVRYLRRQAYDFFQLDGAPVRIWFRSRFKLRSDEDLLSYIHWGNIPEDVRAEWIDEEKKLSDGAEKEQAALDSDEDDDFWEDEPQAASSIVGSVSLIIFAASVAMRPYSSAVLAPICHEPSISLPRHQNFTSCGFSQPCERRRSESVVPEGWLQYSR